MAIQFRPVDQARPQRKSLPRSRQIIPAPSLTLRKTTSVNCLLSSS